MNFNEYQSMAVSTAIYPEYTKIFYPALGLSGEVGELCNKIKKVYRDKNGEFTEETKQQLAGEIGDTLWYISALANDLGLHLDDIAQNNLLKLTSRKERGVIGGNGDNR